ncbi:urease accessory protein UreF [Nesterenkonia cremea]|uniref:Urease accessory protein UreF n=1 Tax=Nesterenkonia cremea TaxID=1882340 RepID=A0A917ASB5_9MICC|nr:urease accessory UreF family protein [Nesterenkonia cremea]GGE70970.1 urease accessory protein UreF [Nesterenkonia cremea]
MLQSPTSAAGAAAQTVGLMLADSRLPSGGHVSSSGLEPALMAGMGRDQVEEYMLVRARTAALTDAGAAAVIRHGLLEAGQNESGQSSAELLTRTERAWAARTPSRAARQIASELGRGLLRLATSLWPDAAILRQLGTAPSRPVVMGAVAAHAQLEAEELVRLVVYDDAAAAAAALLKLDPGDPAEAMILVLQTCASVEDRVAGVAALTEPSDIPSSAAVQMEDWIEHHAHTTRRLFRA